MDNEDPGLAVPGQVPHDGADTVTDSWGFSFSDALAHLLGGNQIDRKLTLYTGAMDTVADWYEAEQTDCTVELRDETGTYTVDSLDEMQDRVFDGGHVDAMELSYRDGDHWFALAYETDAGEVEFEADGDLPYLDRLHQDLDVI